MTAELTSAEDFEFSKALQELKGTIERFGYAFMRVALMEKGKIALDISYTIEVEHRTRIMFNALRQLMAFRIAVGEDNSLASSVLFLQQLHALWKQDEDLKIPEVRAPNKGEIRRLTKTFRWLFRGETPPSKPPGDGGGRVRKVA